ncbi:MAG: UvrD-helicase domain-containing protein [Cyclobacteriaceae bacterium]
MPQPFVIYRSSAGSGKTYTLTKEYLKLAFRHSDYFKHILAVTFTNKATKEMKVRILSVLKDLADDGHELAYDLKEATGLNDEQLKQRAGEILSTILHNYSYFSVSTIDSFFQRVIRAFAREMGLQGGFRIELNEEQVLTEIIDKVLLDVGQNESLTKWLINFAENKVDDGKPWDTRREIGNLGKEILKENFKIYEKQILEIARDQDFIPGFLKELYKVKNDFEVVLNRLGNEALVIINDHGLDVTDFAYKESGPAGYLEKLANRKYMPPGIRVEASALDVNSWFAKSNPLKAKIKACAEAGLVTLLAEAVVHYKSNLSEYESATQVLRNLYTFGILADLTNKLQEYRDENELMLISDASVFLRQIISDNDAPFIYEKVGSRFKHYLIDEFQDTSGFQWDNFRPLIENSLAEEKFNLIVGDVKQAIYRWRSGDFELLLNGVEDGIGSDRIEIKDLTQNWRSRQNIVDFNNSLFKFSSEFLKLQAKNKISEVVDEASRVGLQNEAEKIEEAYSAVIQEGAKKFESGDNGLVQLKFFPWADENGVDWKDNSLAEVPRMVEELQDKKYNLSDIAILVRTRQEGRDVVDYLLSYQSIQAKKGYRYDVISSESLYLENSSITRFLLSVIRYIYKPDDAIQRVQMAYEYCRYIKKTDHELNSLFADSSDQKSHDNFNKLFPDVFFQSLNDLRKLPIYQLIEQLIQLFELDKFDEERAYLQGFLDAILDFTKSENDDILSFLTWWDKLGKDRTVMVSEDQNAIRVMTIHMAKGLQFKAVVVPFCEWGLDNLQGWDNILWSQNHQGQPFDQVPYLPLNYTTSLKSTIFFKDYYNEMIRSYIDNLNIMYVAFTRAEEVLMASCLQHKSKGEIRGTSGLIGEYFKSDFKVGNFIPQVEQTNEEMKLGTYPNVGIEEIDLEFNPLALDYFPSYTWNDRLTIKRELSGLKAPENAEVDPIVILEIFKSLESVATLDSTINQKINEGYAHADQRGVIKARILELFKDEKVASWFNPATDVAMDAVVLTIEGELKVDRIVYSNPMQIVVFTIEKKEDDLLQLKKAVDFFNKSSAAESFLFDVNEETVLQAH